MKKRRKRKQNVEIVQQEKGRTDKKKRKMEKYARTKEEKQRSE